MKPGHGDLLLAEGDPELDEDAERLVAEFRRQLDLGMWAMVPTEATPGRARGADGSRFRRNPARNRARRLLPTRRRRLSVAEPEGFDPSESAAPSARRAALLADVAGERELDAYDALGFISFEPASRDYGYLLYPHRPIVVFDPATGEPLGEWCVRFRDEGEPLPPADDVLAKWLSLSANERGLAERANVDPLGTQIDPGHVRRDLDVGRCAARSRAPSVPGGPARLTPNRLAAEMSDNGSSHQSSRARARPPSSTAPTAPPPAPT